MPDSKKAKNIKNVNNLVWIDMEMTGLDQSQNVILEIAVIITDSNLNILAETPSYVIFQPEEELKKMDKWNVSTHTKSGLIDKVRISTNTELEIEQEILKLLKKYTYKGKSPLCGNTIHQDRKFLVKYMPQLEEFLHYRNLDVSTLKELGRRWFPDIVSGFSKHNKHEALADIRESINELMYYRENMLIKPPAPKTEI